MTPAVVTKLGPRTLAALFVLAFLLVAGALAAAPAAHELSAMRDRSALERAHLLEERGDFKGAARTLGQAVKNGARSAEVVRALLYALERSENPKAHAEVVFGPPGEALAASDLRAAAAYYSRSGLADAKLEAQVLLMRRGAALTNELYEIAQARRAAGDLETAAQASARIIERLTPGSEPPLGVFAAATLRAAGQTEEAGAFVRRWLGPPTSLADALAIAPALIEAGAADLAVEALALRAANGPEAEAAYRSALRAASPASQPARAQLTEFALADLALAKNKPQADAALYELFTYGEVDRGVAALAVDGAWGKPLIRASFLAHMKAAGRIDAARVLIAQEALGPGVTARQRLSAAHELLALDAPAPAADALKLATAAEGPSSPAFQDLVFVWRTRLGGLDEAWIQSQVNGAPEAAAGDWARAIAREVSARAAAEALMIRQAKTYSFEVATLAARYLAAANDYAAMRELLRDAAARGATTDTAGRLAELACAADDAETAVRLARVASRLSATAEGCVSSFELAQAREALARGDLDDALARYGDLERRDIAPTAQDHFDLGLALLRAKRDGDAQGHFEAAVQALPAGGRLSNRERILRAAALMRLARSDEAATDLEAALAADPMDKQARVMLAQLYLAKGDNLRALAIARP